MDHLKINFYPVCDNEYLIKAAEEYQNIWDNEGNKITEIIEKISHLHFKSKFFNSLVLYGQSSAFPFLMRANYSTQTKKATLIHELCHRLLNENGIRQTTPELAHQQIFLILYDIWEELYGESFAQEKAKEESERNRVYKNTWNRVLSRDKNSRNEEFKKLSRTAL